MSTLLLLAKHNVETTYFPMRCHFVTNKHYSSLYHLTNYLRIEARRGEKKQKLNYEVDFLPSGSFRQKWPGCLVSLELYWTGSAAVQFGGP